MEVFNKIKLQIKYIDSVKGFGVFALENINIGDIVEICYCVSTYNLIVNPVVDYIFEKKTNDKTK